MRRMIVAVDGSPASSSVIAAADVFADLLGLERAVMQVSGDRSEMFVDDSGTEVVVVEGDPAVEIMSASRQPDVVLTVVGSRAAVDDPRPAGHVATAVVEQADKPVLVVPPTAPPLALRRMVLPLEGTPATGAADDGILRELLDAGVAPLVLHVFDESTVPMFWDDAHTAASFSHEFRHRWCPAAPAVSLRRGEPGRRVLDVCGDEDADLIALRWNQDLSPGHAAVVRTVLAGTPVPVLLVPGPPPPASDPDAARR